MTIEPESAKATPIPFNPLHFGAQLPREGKSNSRVEALEKLAEIPPDIEAAGKDAVERWLKRSVKLNRHDVPETMGEIRQWALEELACEIHGAAHARLIIERGDELIDGTCEQCGVRVLTTTTNGLLLCRACAPHDYGGITRHRSEPGLIPCAGGEEEETQGDWQPQQPRPSTP